MRGLTQALGCLLLFLMAVAAASSAVAVAEAESSIVIERQTPSANRLVGVGIAVYDLSRAYAFYTTVMGMKPLTTYNTSTYDEIVLYYPNTTTASLVLMSWHDGRGPSQTTPVPVKVVFFVRDPRGLARRIRDAGLQVTSTPGRFTTGFARDPDGYTVEINNVAALETDADAVLAAVGIGMQDLPTGLKFYQEAVGMERQSTLRLGGWDEHILNFPGAEGSSLVLVNWHDGKTREYKDVPVKLVFGLQDPVAFAKNLAVKGGTVIQEPAPRPEVGGATVGFGRDLMGYLLEMVKLSQLGGSTASNATKL